MLVPAAGFAIEVTGYDAVCLGGVELLQCTEKSQGGARTLYGPFEVGGMHNRQ